MAFALYTGKIPWLRGDDDGEFATILGLSRIIGRPTKDKWPGIEYLPKWGPLAPKLEQLSAGAPEEVAPPPDRLIPYLVTHPRGRPLNDEGHAAVKFISWALRWDPAQRMALVELQSTLTADLCTFARSRLAGGTLRGPTAQTHKCG